MRLVLDRNPSPYAIRAWRPGQVQVGDRLLERPFILAPRKLIDGWTATRLAGLDADTLAPALALEPRILLVGIDAEVAPTAPRELRRLAERRGIALDVMNLGAACRTYEVLAGEGREVVALMLLAP